MGAALDDILAGARSFGAQQAPPAEPSFGQFARAGAASSILSPLFRSDTVQRGARAAPGAPFSGLLRGAGDFLESPETTEATRAVEARRGFEAETGTVPGYGTAAKRTIGELGGALAMDVPLFFVPGGAVLREFGLAGRAALAATRFGPTATRLAPTVAESMALFGSGGLARESLKQATGEAPFDPAHVVLEGAREAVVGAALGFAKAGPASKAAQLAGEFAVFGVGAPALQGRLPTREDLVGAAALTAGFSAMHRVFGPPEGRPNLERMPGPEQVERAVSERSVTPEQAQLVDLITREIQTNVAELGLSPRESDLLVRVGRADVTQQLLADPKGFAEKFSPAALQRVQADVIREQDAARQAELEMQRFNREQYPTGKSPTGFGTEVRVAPGETGAVVDVPARGKVATAGAFEMPKRANVKLPGGELVQGGLRRGFRPSLAESSRSAELGEGSYVAAREPEIAGRTKASPSKAQVETSSLLKKAQSTITRPAEPEVLSETSKTLRAADQTLSSARLDPKPIETAGPRNIQVDRLDRAIESAPTPALRGQLRRLRRLVVEPERVRERGRPLPDATREATIDRLLEDPAVRRELDRHQVQGPEGAGPVSRRGEPLVRRFRTTDEPRSGARGSPPAEVPEAEMRAQPTSGLIAENEPRMLPASPDDLGLRPAVEARDGRVLMGEPGESWAKVAERNQIPADDVSRYGYAAPEAPEVLIGGGTAAQAVMSARRERGAQLAEEMDLPFRLAEERRLEEAVGRSPETVQAEESARGARPQIPDPAVFLRPGGQKLWEELQEQAFRATNDAMRLIGTNMWNMRALEGDGSTRTVVREGVRTVAGGRIGANDPQRNRIMDDMLRDGRVRAMGQRVSNPLELATLAQMFGRTPHFEVMNFVATKGGEVVGIRALSSRLPFSVGSVPFSELDVTLTRSAATPELSRAFVSAIEQHGIRELKAWVKKTGADGLHLVHNHPSGYANPSNQDIVMTRYYAREFPELRSHVVLDHGHFANIPLDGAEPKLYPLPPEVTRAGDLRAAAEVQSELLGMPVADDPGMMAAVAEQFGTGERIVTIVHRDHYAKIAAIQQVPAELFVEDRYSARREADKISAVNSLAYYNGSREDVIQGLLRSINRNELDLIYQKQPDGTHREALRFRRDKPQQAPSFLLEQEREMRYEPEPLPREPVRYAAPLGTQVPDISAPYQGQHHSVWAAGAAKYRNAMLEKWGTELEAQRRSRIPLAKQREMARQLNMTDADWNALLGKQGLALPAEFQERFVLEWEQGVDRIARLGGEISAEKDQARRAKLQTELESVGDATAKLWMAVQASGSELGRSLGARARRLGRHRSLATATRAVLDETRLPRDQAQRMVRDLIEANGDRQRIRRVLSEAYVPDFWDKVIELRTMYLLSSPVTHMRNAVGNTLAASGRLIENGSGVSADFLYSTLTGKPRERHFVELTSDVLGLWKGAQEGARMFTRALSDEAFAMARGRIGEATPKAAIKPDLPGQGLSRFQAVNEAQGPIGRAVRIPGRFLAATDILFTAMNRYGEAYRRSAREVLKTSPELKGVERADAIQKLAREAIGTEETRLMELTGKLDQAKTTAERIALAAEDASREATFRRELGTYWKRVDAMRFATYTDPVTGKTHKHPAAVVARIFVPFLPTPVNILSWGIERLPGVGLLAQRNRALFKLLGKDAKDLSREQLLDIWGRQAVGAMLFLPLLSYAMEGKITGAPDKDESVRAMKKAFGIEPHSIKVLGEWKSYRGFSPVSEFLAVAAEFAEAHYARGEVPTTERAMRVAMAMTATFIDQPFLTGLSDVIDALSDPAAGEQRLTSIAGNLASSFVVPRGVALAARAFDTTQRDYPETIGDKIRQDTPGLRGSTVPMRDPIGRKYEGTLADSIGRAILPTGDPSKATAVDRMLWLAAGMPHQSVVNYPARIQLGRRLSPEAYDQLLAAKEKALMPVLERFAQRGEAMAQNPGGRELLAKYIQRFETRATEAARMEVLPRFELDELGVPVTPETEARMRLLIGNNALSRVRELYEHPANTNEDRIWIFNTGRLPPGTVREPVQPGEIR